MAHFAKLNENNIVVYVTVGRNEDDGQENTLFTKTGDVYKQTSYNTIQNTHKSGDNSKAFRGNYAGIGMEWDEDNQIFWSKKPYTSWVKDTATASWKSPIGDAPALTAEQTSQNEAGTHKWGYDWNESGQSWDLTDRSA